MTDGVAYVAALVLASIFVFSAWAKLRNGTQTRRSLNAAGVPGATAIAWLIPRIELAVALLLVVTPLWGAVVAVALLLAFTAFVVYMIRHDIDESCGCFGADASEPVSFVDILRNAMLMALALVAASAGEPAGVRVEEVILVTTAGALGATLLAAATARHRLGQLFDNRLPGER